MPADPLEKLPSPQLLGIPPFGLPSLPASTPESNDMQPQPDPIVNAHRSVGSGSLPTQNSDAEGAPPDLRRRAVQDIGVRIPTPAAHLPFRMKMKRAAHGYLCDAARCEDEGEVHYGANTNIGRAYGRDSTRLCGRHLKLFYRWTETQ